MRWSCQTLRGEYLSGYKRSVMWVITSCDSSVFGNLELSIRWVTYTGLHRKKQFSSGKKTWEMLKTRLPCGDSTACWEPLCIRNPEDCLPTHPACNQGRMDRTAVQRWNLCHIPLQIWFFKKKIQQQFLKYVASLAFHSGQDFHLTFNWNFLHQWHALQLPFSGSLWVHIPSRHKTTGPISGLGGPF